MSHRVEVRHVGDSARLFVNGHGIASWPWGGPCANDSTGEEYAVEVMRALRAALEANTTLTNRMRPIHPGEILLEEFLKPLAMSANALARALHVPPNRVTAVVAGKRGVTADTALRLSAALGTTAEFWMNLQKAYDLRVEELDKENAADRRGIRRLVKLRLKLV